MTEIKDIIMLLIILWLSINIIYIIYFFLNLIKRSRLNYKRKKKVKFAMIFNFLMLIIYLILGFILL